MSHIDAGDEETVRQARYQLARALLRSPASAKEAVDHLDRAVTEAGDDPPTWELQRCGAVAVADADPNDAVKRYARSLQHGAPDDVAHDARRWLESLHPGTLRAGRSADLTRLLSRETTPAVRLFGATLLRALGDSEGALHESARISSLDEAIELPLRVLQARCLIDLNRLLEARKVLDDAPTDAGITVLRAKLHFARKEFEQVLEILDKLGGPRNDEAEALRNQALIGADRSDEIVWDPPEATDATGLQTWLSRGVAALVTQRYDKAHEAASWVERSSPQSLSAQLLHAQADLEAHSKNDELQQGLITLRSVVASEEDRNRPPYWLERQREVRSDGRFRYFLCEYELMQRGSVSLASLEAVKTTDTTWAQDGRIAELAAAAHGSGPAWTDALDQAAAAYTTAGDHAAAARVAHEVFAVEPTLARASVVGWAVFKASFADDAAAPIDARGLTELLQRAIAAVEETLPGGSHKEILDAILLLAALKVRHVQSVDTDMIRSAFDGARWAFASAIGAIKSPIRQQILSWVLAQTSANPAAAFDTLEYAATLDPSAVPPYARLMARVGLVGVDAETLRLLEAAEANSATSTDENETDVATRQQLQATALYFALLDDDREGVRRHIRSDVGESPWALTIQGLASVILDGATQARPVLAQRLEVLRRDKKTVLHQAWLTAMSGDIDEADELLVEARRLGNDSAADIDKAVAATEYLRDPARSLVQFSHDALDRVRSQRELLWFERVVLPCLATATGQPWEPVRTEVAAAFETRRRALEETRNHWDRLLADQDPVVGALARLWRAAVGRDAKSIRSRVEAVRRLDVPEPLLTALANVTAQQALVSMVDEIAAGRIPDAELAEELGDDPSPEACLVRALAGVGGPDEPLTGDTSVACGAALVEALRSLDADAEGLWRVYDATAAATERAGSHLGTELLRNILDVIGQSLGFDVPPSEGYRSYLSFILGDAFVPEDTGPKWSLFSELIPALTERIRTATGYSIPGFNVRRDRRGDPENVLHLILHEAVIKTYHLPTDGMVVLVPEPPDVGPGVFTGVDPLSGSPVIQVRAGDVEPPGVTERWKPLEFVMRHVERFVRDNLASVVSVSDAVSSADPDSKRGRAVLSDAVAFTGWLAEVRANVSEHAASLALADEHTPVFVEGGTEVHT